MKSLITIPLILLFTFSELVNASPRIVSANAGATELLNSLGLTENIIAIDVTSAQPNNDKQLPVIGYHRMLSAEGLMSLDPSILIGSNQMGPESTLSLLRKAGVSVLSLAQAMDFKSLKENVAKMAIALERPKRGDEVLRELDLLSDELKPSLLTNKKIAFLLAVQAPDVRIAGQNTTGNAFISLIGGQNAAEFKNYRSLSKEALLAIDPDVIIIATSASKHAMRNVYASLASLEHTRASTNNMVVDIRASSLVAGLSVDAMKEAVRISNVLAKDK